jgi:hypothetical protein
MGPPSTQGEETMIKALLATVASAAALLAAYPAHASDDGLAIIDLLDGVAEVAEVSSDLEEALADARIAAFAQGRLLSIPMSLEFHPAAGSGRALVTLGPRADS